MPSVQGCIPHEHTATSDTLGSYWTINRPLLGEANQYVPLTKINLP